MATVSEPGRLSAARNPRILCVDDEPYVLDGLRDILRRSFDVHACGSAAEGLAALRAEPDAFSIVISDMRMPGKAGDVFLREARLVAPHAVRMLLTGHADVDSAIRAVNHAQLFRFLTKPCDAQELMQACAAALGQHRLLTAERTLLEQTLRGSVDALVSALALANPAAFGRGGRVKDLAGRLAKAAGLKVIWEVEVAAMLAQIGAVTIPQATAERLYAGVTLSPEEKAMVERIPYVTRQLLAKIPRLEGVVEILDAYRLTPDPGEYEALDPVPIPARILRIVADYDELEFRGIGNTVALGTLGARGIYDRDLLKAFARVVGVGADAPAVCEISLAQLRVGMRLADDVRNAGGGLLVARGQSVTEQLIERLDNLRAVAIRQPLRVFEAETAG
jgi:response regulator RpfG family c-di-GMP phosphodiesterase